MAEPGVYLEKLSAFSRLLRRKGLNVGPGETGDAARVLTALGLADREMVKTALRTVYASSREEQIEFVKLLIQNLSLASSNNSAGSYKSTLSTY